MEQSHMFYRLPAISFFAIPGYKLSLNQRQYYAIFVSSCFKLSTKVNINHSFHLHMFTLDFPGGWTHLFKGTGSRDIIQMF
jgi:hypothetical protein